MNNDIQFCISQGGEENRGLITAQKIVPLSSIEQTFRQSPPISRSKRGPWFVPASFKDIDGGGEIKRDQRSLNSVYGFVFDYDQGIESVDQVRSAWDRSGLRHCLHTTFSHIEKGVRVRVLVPLSEPVKINGPEDIERVKQKYRGLGQQIGLPYDSAGEDPSHFYYTRRVPEARKDQHVSHVNDSGTLFDFKSGATAKPTAVPTAEKDPATTEAVDFDSAIEWKANRDKLVAAINAVPPDEVTRDEWRTIGMALKHAAGDDLEAFEIWDSWSQKDQGRYKPGECQKQWEDFGAREVSSPITIGSIYKLAKKYGWTDLEPQRDVGSQAPGDQAGQVVAVEGSKGETAGQTVDGSKEVDFLEPKSPRTVYDIAPVSAEGLGLKIPPPPKYIYTFGPDKLAGLVGGIVGTESGQGSGGKTTDEVQNLASLASGLDCTFGQCNFEEEGPVIGAFLENSIESIERLLYRIRQECEATYGKDPDLRHLHLIPARPGASRLFLKDTGGNLIKSPGFHQLAKLVEEIRPVKITLDSLSLVAGLAEEKNNFGADIIDGLGDLCEWGASVIVLAHPNKASVMSKGQKVRSAPADEILHDALEPESVRGSGSIVANGRWTKTVTIVPGWLSRRLGCPENTLLTAYAIRKTNLSRRLECAYLLQEFRELGFTGTETMLLKPFEPIEEDCSMDQAISQEAVKNSIVAYVKERGQVQKRVFTKDTRLANSEFRTSRDNLEVMTQSLIGDGYLEEFKGEFKIKWLRAVKDYEAAEGAVENDR